MPRTPWKRHEEWSAQPHSKDGPPPSLWWYRYPDRHSVINAYIARYSKGRAVPPGFKDEIVKAVAALSDLQNKKEWGNPKTLRYWTIPAYARANGLKKATVMKWLRELEVVGKRMFPDRVPASREPRPPLTEEDIMQIRRRYLESEKCKALAQEYRIPASKVGHLCREERAIRRATDRSPQQSPADTESAPAPYEPESDIPY